MAQATMELKRIKDWSRSTSKPPRRSELITLRLTADELSDLRAAAAQTGLTVADFLRRAANHMLKRGAVLEPSERAWAAGIAEELRRVGVNLNQVARAVNGGRLADTHELASELNEHIETVRALAYAYAHLSDGAARVGRLVPASGKGAS